MPGVARDSRKDIAGGKLIQGSKNVFVNGKPAVRDGDLVEAHGKPPHAGGVRMIQGSGSVYVNGKKLCRIGDKASCGHAITSGSSNVFAGG